jgi:hypothetical protein
MINEAQTHIAVHFLSNLAQGVDTEIPGTVDPLLNLIGNKYQLDRDWVVRKVYAQSTTLNRAKLNIQGYAIPQLPHILPIARSTLPSDLPKIMEMGDQGWKLKSKMAWSYVATSDLGSGSEACVIVTMLGKPEGLRPIPPGDVYTLRCTTSATLTANAWTLIPTITPEIGLPNDTFHVCGCTVVSPNAVAFRFRPRNGLLAPGGLCSTGFGNRSFDDQYVNGIGLGTGPGSQELFSFDNTALPQIEIFALAADTNPVIFMQVVRETVAYTPGILAG